MRAPSPRRFRRAPRSVSRRSHAVRASKLMRSRSWSSGTARCAPTLPRNKAGCQTGSPERPNGERAVCPTPPAGPPAAGLRRLGDLAGTDAPRADEQPAHTTVDRGADGLQVWAPDALALVVGVTDFVSDRAALAADITDSCH